jgi:hypothetical protein
MEQEKQIFQPNTLIDPEFISLEEKGKKKYNT